MMNNRVKDGKRTVEGWSYLVRCSVMNVSQEDAGKVGKMCFDAEARGDGENCSVWHQWAQYRGSKCNCAKCHPAKAFKYHHVA